MQVRLVDAGFIWTESHSKRLKVKLTKVIEGGEIHHPNPKDPTSVAGQHGDVHLTQRMKPTILLKCVNGGIFVGISFCEIPHNADQGDLIALEVFSQGGALRFPITKKSGPGPVSLMQT